MKNNLQNTRLVGLLQLLSTAELKAFSKWLQSPWANSNKKLITCFRFLIRYHPSFDVKTLTKERLFKTLYPKKEYDDKWMRNLMGGLSKQLERFLAHQRLEQDELLKKRMLAAEFQERHRDDWYEKYTNAICKDIEGKKVKESKDYLLLSILQEELYYRPEAPEKNYGSQTPLDSANTNLDTFYAIAKWRFATELNERHLLLKKQEQTGDSNQWGSEYFDHLEIPAVEAYKRYQAFSGLVTKEQFLLLKNSILSAFDKFEQQDKKLLIYYLINAVIRLWQQGDVTILEELFLLYKKGLKEAVFEDWGRMSVRTYTNIITTGNSLKQFDFIEKFIEEYAAKLDPLQKKDASIWGLGHLYFKKGSYRSCIDLLGNYSFTNFTLALLSKSVLLEAYFCICFEDESYYTFFIDYSNAYQKYIRRNRAIAEKRKIAFLNFIKYCGQILQLKMNKKLNDQSLESILLKINKEQHIQSKQWLTEQIALLKRT